MSSMTKFTFGGQVVRAMGDEDGNAWFVGKDICKILGFKDPGKAMNAHCSENSELHSIIDGMGRSQEVRVLGPIDVLQLSRRSTLPVPERFESWLLQDVLSALYKPSAGPSREAHQAQLDHVKSILEISQAVIQSGVSARKSLAVALDLINAQKSQTVEPFQTKILARIAARASANEAASVEPSMIAATAQTYSNQQRIAMSSMTTFTFGDQTVRAMGDDDGKAWFVGKDICKILGFRNSHDAMAAHCLAETTSHTIIDGMGRSQEVRVLGPIDVLQLSRRSTLPVPERFESWLLQDVLPALYRQSAGPAHQAQLDHVKSILEISKAVIQSGVSARKSLTVALDLIQAQTGMPVASFKELLQGRITQAQSEVIPVRTPNKVLELRTGDLNEESVRAWREFMGMTAHERCLKLLWLAGNPSRAAVIWQLCEKHAQKAAIGFEGAALTISANDIAQRSGRILGGSVSAVRASMSNLIDEGLLHVLPHVDNVTREIWLDWAALNALLKATSFPELVFLELNWIAKNKAEMVVLYALSNGAGCITLAPAALEAQYRPKFGVTAMGLSRAVKALISAGLVERGEGNFLSLAPDKVEKALEQFYLTDLQKLMS